jgi:hypothetical protein
MFNNSERNRIIDEKNHKKELDKAIFFFFYISISESTAMKI